MGAIKDNDINLTEDEIEEILEEIMDVNKSVELGETVLSDSSIKEFIASGGVFSMNSFLVQKFLNGLMGKNSDDQEKSNNDNAGKERTSFVMQLGGSNNGNGGNIGKGILVTP